MTSSNDFAIQIINFLTEYITCFGVFGETITLVKVKVAESCPTLCDPMNYTVHGILQARILEWVAVPFSRGLSHTYTCIHSPPNSPPKKAAT